MMYATPVWHQVTEIGRYKDMVARVQRRMLLKLCAAYRTVSTEAVEVIAGIRPFDLQVRKRANIREREGEKAEAAEVAEETLIAWQRRWDDLRDKAQ